MFFCLYYIIFYYFISVLALSAAVSPHCTPVAIYLGTFIIGYLGSLAYEEQSLSFFLLGWTPQPTESEQTILLYFLLVSLTYKSIFLRENSFLKKWINYALVMGFNFKFSMKETTVFTRIPPRSLFNFSWLKCGAHLRAAFIWKLDETNNCFNYEYSYFPY